MAGYAKVLCSAVFVSGRDPAEAAKNSGDVLMASSGRDKVAWHVDSEQKSVRMTLDGVTREARFYGDQGCIIQRHDKPGIFFTPVPVTTTLPDAMSQPWPMGDRRPDAPGARSCSSCRLVSSSSSGSATRRALRWGCARWTTPSGS